MQEKETSINIIAHLRYGKENAKDRFQLQNETGLPDRVNRKLIEKARKKGEPIMNFSDGRGYYLTTDIQEIKRFQKQEYERRDSISETLRGTYKAIARIRRDEERLSKRG
ncbi:MAG: hypothetical protein ACOX3W_00580 [Christensenellaceae bacterium]|jgi:hypothetical protein